MLHINDLTFRIAGRLLFEQATLAIPDGHKVGLVGRNGSGKSTLFGLIAQERTPDAGSISIRPRARVGYVAQEAPSGDTNLLDTVLAADSERAALLAESETATDPQRIAEIHNRLADIDAHSAESRAASILAGLGFDDDAQARPCKEYSGGWRMRVSLAASLFARPDLLLLDEPTNHLDLEATLWLESYLASWPGTLLVISHERSLLNSVVQEIVHLDEGKLIRYQGNYDYYETTRRERQAQQAALRTRQMDERRRIQAFVDRFRAQATKARQAQSRLKMLARMEPIATAVESRTITFDFPDPDPLSPPLVAMEAATVGYDPASKPILRNLDLRIDMDDRIGLLGANGNGKSTLMKLLADRLKPLDGKLRKSNKLKVGYFAQHQTDELILTDSPYLHMARLMPMEPEARVRGHLGRFGFPGDQADTPVASLSGGEKARLLFALMSRDKPHLMLLDEPTNHLDVDSREALLQALNTYDGAVVLVSHDPHLLAAACDRLWLVENGACTPFDGDVDDYRRYLLDQQRTARRETRRRDGPSRKDDRRAAAEARAKLAPLRKQVKNAEMKLDKLHQDKSILEQRLADPKLYDGPSGPLTELQRQLGETDKALNETEEAWFTAHEELETAILKAESG
ncbi:ABC-F family ATP-binding cassette domain-containing protein [Magnetospira sp. QH-2]|uniref:ABC-F family ATP-binding cassette domain-containing protein n=1 Tax=Magnetospira sp. (strain QH-2) TaxID=1288970 RepID=UPI0003E811D1|nr:ABC-F family ATP-binding cassette domain-containing protein [Magnetospira sp. QH-2]CCQ72841.1 putative ABC transporter, ATP-binding protein with duplicated ATPase domains [Magnetospira sp. QH-2]